MRVCVRSRKAFTISGRAGPFERSIFWLSMCHFRYPATCSGGSIFMYCWFIHISFLVLKADADFETFSTLKSLIISSSVKIS